MSEEIIKMDFHRRLIETIISRQPLDIVDEIKRRLLPEVTRSVYSFKIYYFYTSGNYN